MPGIRGPYVVSAAAGLARTGHCRIAQQRVAALVHGLLLLSTSIDAEEHAVKDRRVSIFTLIDV